MLYVVMVEHQSPTCIRSFVRQFTPTPSYVGIEKYNISNTAAYTATKLQHYSTAQRS
ncbi:hypothetical protein C8R31_106173 [Nitrosospira sp. Nsp2]|nr:hypothetical protein C8R31_106173 [Nitrosospira sp. Nsp2]